MAITPAGDVAVASHSGTSMETVTPFDATDCAGNVYVTGHFGDGGSGTLDLGGAELISAGGYEQIFAASYDSDGVLRWARGPGEGRIVGRTIAAAPCGEVVVGGTFSGPATFLDGSSSTPTAGPAPFVTRFVP